MGKKEELETTLLRLKTLSQGKKEERALELNKKMDEEKSADGKARNKFQQEIELEAEDMKLQKEVSALTSQYARDTTVLDRELHSATLAHERGCQSLQAKTR